jgi:sodium/hydrogen antiporter
MLMFDFWNWRTISLAIFIFAIARPVSVFIGALGTNTPWRIQGTVGWFGVRGIGSIYYLMYAIQHGVPHAIARELTQFTLIVVALSILVHGISVKPMMNEMEKK